MQNDFPYTLQAPAKVNLLLRITGKREDGFHELVTLFHSISTISDKISADLKADPGIKLTCGHPDVPVDGSNLVVRAARAFADKMGLSPAWSFELTKEIPIAAGMGGGSSDAGSLLRFLADKFPGCPEEELNALARSIGADIPFFLSPGDAIGRGIGEKLEQLPELPMPPMLFVSPGVPVSAAWAYRHLQAMTPREQAEEEAAAMTELFRAGEFRKAAALCANDLEGALFAKFPLLRVLRSTLEEKGALCVHVSGSGPTLFAVFEEPEMRHQAAQALAAGGSAENGIRIMEC